MAGRRRRANRDRDQRSRPKRGYGSIAALRLSSEGLPMTRAYNVVDADGHILEPLDLWDKYMDPEFRERRPRFVIDDNGKERLSVEGKLLGNPRGIGSLGSVGVRQGIIKAGTLKYADGRKGGFDPHARIVDMDADGIDAAFLYPGLGLFAGAVEDPGLAAAMCRAYNRWLADYCKPYPERLFGIAMLPMQSVELAVDEMRYAREKIGMRGGFLRPKPLSRQEDYQRPDVRAVLDDGRGPRLLHRLSRGIDQRDADRRRRPVRGRPRGAPHGLAHHGDDVGRAERDLGRCRRPSSALARRVSRVGRRLDRAVARPHGPALR